jgi:hypothetical protein
MTPASATQRKETHAADRHMSLMSNVLSESVDTSGDRDSASHVAFDALKRADSRLLLVIAQVPGPLGHPGDTILRMRGEAL